MIKCKEEDTIIVTRHPGLVEWLKERGITGKVQRYVTEKQVRGKHIIGEIPAHVAKNAFCMTEIIWSDPYRMFGPEGLTYEDVVKLKPELFTYVVVPIISQERKVIDD